MIYDFNRYINEELKIQEMDIETLEQVNRNLKFRLDEYRTYILKNIHYNLLTNKIEFKDFEQVDINIILRELNNEFGEDMIKELNIFALLRQINQILELKKRNTKKRVREFFDKYYKDLDRRIERIKSGYQIDDDHFDEVEGEKSLLGRKRYEKEKYKLQIELAKLQEWVTENNKRIAIVFEGRDAAGKGSTIKRFIEYLNPKGFRVVTLGIPTEEEKNNWLKDMKKNYQNQEKLFSLTVLGIIEQWLNQLWVIVQKNNIKILSIMLLSGKRI